MTDPVLDAIADELSLDVGEILEDFVAHGVVDVDRSTKPPTYQLIPEDKMTPEARKYWKKKLKG